MFLSHSGLETLFKCNNLSNCEREIIYANCDEGLQAVTAINLRGFNHHHRVGNHRTGIYFNKSGMLLV